MARSVTNPTAPEPPALRAISLGAGVQSTALYLMACEGDLGKVDAAIFADTGWEPAAVYRHLDRLADYGGDQIPIFRVSAGNIRDTDQGRSYLDIPYFLSGRKGSPGMSRRQCTGKLKIGPIRRKLSELLAATGTAKRAGAAESLLGISVDEITRMKDSDARWVRNGFPLVDRRLRRSDCSAFLRERGWNPPRSACIGCPFHSDAEWRRLKLEAPEEFADAVAFEREVQQKPGGLRGMPFLHASRVPLSRVDLTSAEDHGQLTFDAECDGLCGL
ncbi:MAG TPA: hypothetical protein VH299_14555 [Solirubrobacterales bacterium]|nr:hypothetical protein [Solirubrobacterales bacterium]